MARKKRKIKYSKERVVMADILPYEVPITFSNRHFYDFIVENKIEFTDGKVSWKKKDEGLDKLICFLFNLSNDIQDSDSLRSAGKNVSDYKCQFLYTIPFTFKISHKQSSFRELTIIHPINQLAIIDFYERYKWLIIYFCTKSPYSIRRPHKIAKYTYFNDIKHKRTKVDEPERDIIEVFGREYKNLKTYFSYEKYSNIYKFYESYSYQRNEKKFDKLFKFDISKCFDSIYTHSISWAVFNKEIIKEHIAGPNGVANNTFGGVFDTLMQKMNYNETNGIIIGPEFSRIFAEILLQQIDFNVNEYLNIHRINNNIEYTVFRYVDDYFLFYNDENVKDSVLECFRGELKKYNLYINEAKSFTYEKPIITELTIAKEKISNLLKNNLKLEVQDMEGSEVEEDNINFKPKRYKLYFSARRTTTAFKSIIKETNVEYKDILNYTLAIIDRRLFNIIKKYSGATFESNLKEQKFKSIFINALHEILDFIMFLYSVAPRVNTTIKLCIILSKVTKFIKEKPDNRNKKYFNQDQKNLIFKKIYDDITLVLNKNRNSEYTQVETLYLLIALQDLGKDYRLGVKTLMKYLNINEKERVLYFPYDFNYWSISVLLFYIKNTNRYAAVKRALKEHILEKYKVGDEKFIKRNTELVLLTMDLISCPYLDKKFKKNLLKSCGINEHKQEILDKLENQNSIFTRWRNFDFEKELNTKISQEVY